MFYVIFQFYVKIEFASLDGNIAIVERFTEQYPVIQAALILAHTTKVEQSGEETGNVLMKPEEFISLMVFLDLPIFLR